MFDDLNEAVLDAFGKQAVFDPAGAAHPFDCTFDITRENDFDSGVVVSVAEISYTHSELASFTISAGSVFLFDGIQYAAMAPPEVDDTGWATVRARKV